MNKQRRREIAAVEREVLGVKEQFEAILEGIAEAPERSLAVKAASEQLQALGDRAKDLKDRVGELRDEEQEYYDDMPENFRSGERGDAAQASAEELGGAAGELEDVACTLRAADGTPGDDDGLDLVAGCLDAACEHLSSAC